jgi:hypothetical protein
MYINTKIKNINIDHLTKNTVDIWNKLSIRIIPLLGIIFLTIASGFTTYLGIENYTSLVIIGMFATLGVQAFMLYASVRIGILASLQDTKFWYLLVLYCVAMLISSFFSFANFHSQIETEERRAFEAEAVIRDKWAELYDKVIEQTSNEFDAKLNLAADPQEAFSTWLAEYERIQGISHIFVNRYLAEAQRNIIDLEGATGTTELEKTRLNQNFYSTLDKLETLSAKLADARLTQAGIDAEITTLAEQIERELIQGGSVQIDGTVSPPGDGPIYKSLKLRLAKLTEDAENQKTLIRTLENEENILQRNRDQIQRSLDSLRQSKNTETNQRLIDLKVLADALQQVRNSASRMPDIDASMEMTSVTVVKQQLPKLQRAANACSDVQASLRVAMNELEKSGQSPADESRGLLEVSCDTLPVLGAGSIEAGLISNFSKFESKCNPAQLPVTETKSYEKPKNNSDQTNISNILSVFQSETEEAKKFYNQQYEKNYAILRKATITCMAEIPPSESLGARREINSTFQRFLIDNNPKAHPFTRAIAAFERGDQSAYLAAFIALAIDAMILVCCLAMRRPSEDSHDNASISIDIDEVRDTFLQQNPTFCMFLLSSTHKIVTKGATTYECELPHIYFDDKINLLHRASDLGFIDLKIEKDGTPSAIKISEEKFNFLAKSIKMN